MYSRLLSFVWKIIFSCFIILSKQCKQGKKNYIIGANLNISQLIKRYILDQENSRSSNPFTSCLNFRKEKIIKKFDYAFIYSTLLTSSIKQDLNIFFLRKWMLNLKSLKIIFKLSKHSILQKQKVQQRNNIWWSILSNMPT